jgi:Clostripain family
MTNTQKTRKPWSLLAYTVADEKIGRPLDEWAPAELKALCDAADLNAVSIAAQVDFSHRKGVFRGALTAAPPRSRGFKDVTDQSGPLWDEILGEVDADRSLLRVQKEAADLNSARGSVLRQFLRFGQRECPADRYVVFFYGHAAGPFGLFCDRTTGERKLDTLRLNDLADSLEANDLRAGVLVFRDCFMNTLETAYELRDTAEFMIASQALAPVDGVWPWSDFLATLKPSADASDVGLGIVKRLAHFLDEDEKHREGLAAVPYSLLDLSAAEACIAPLASLVEALDAARTDTARGRACGAALEAARVGRPKDDKVPGDPALLDVPTLCERLSGLVGDPVAAPATALGKVVGARLVRWHHSQTSFQRGTSLFYKPVRGRHITASYLQAEDPKVAAEDAACYRKLALPKATGWDRIALDPFPVW